MKTHTPGPWWCRGMAVLRDNGGHIASANYHASFADVEERQANAQLIAAAPELLALAEQSAVDRSAMPAAPEDAEVLALCLRRGFGAVMDSAARQWRRSDPIGALTIGDCVATVLRVLAKARGEP